MRELLDHRSTIVSVEDSYEEKDALDHEIRQKRNSLFNCLKTEKIKY